MTPTRITNTPNSQQTALRDALLRSGQFLGLTTRELAGIVGVSTSTLSRLRRGQAALEPGGKSWELARLFVKFVVDLGTLTSADERAAREWFDNYNHTLGAIPRERVQSIVGLTDTVAYVAEFVHRP